MQALPRRARDNGERRERATALPFQTRRREARPPPPSEISASPSLLSVSKSLVTEARGRSSVLARQRAAEALTKGRLRVIITHPRTPLCESAPVVSFLWT